MIGSVLAWLVNHIARVDMAIVGNAVPRPRKRAETESVGETIKDVMSNMFSVAFCGEKPMLIKQITGERILEKPFITSNPKIHWKQSKRLRF